MSQKSQQRVVVIQENGQLELKAFQARTFAQALEHELPDDWRTNPKALAKCVKRTPDLLTLTLGIMGSFEELLWQERQAVEEDIRARTEALEKAATDVETIKADVELNDLYDKLDGYDDRLWAIEELAPHKWLKSLSSLEYLAVVFSVEQFLGQTMTPAWTSFCAHKDNAKLATVHAFRLLPLEVLDALQIEFVELSDASLPIDVCTALTAKQANAVAERFHLKLTFEAAPKKRGRKKAAPKQTDVATDAPAESTPAETSAETSPTEAPATGKKPARKTTTRKPRAPKAAVQPAPVEQTQP